MWENATNSCRMMEAIVQIGSAGMSAPLGSVPLGKKSRADGLLHNSAVGALMGVITFAITWSFFFTTPGVVHWSLSADPIAWNLTGEFIFKDIVLLCVCVVLLLASLPRSVIRQRSR